MIEESKEIRQQSPSNAKNEYSSDIRRLRVIEQVRTLYTQAPISNFAIMVLVVLFALILRQRVDSILINIWVLLVCTSATIRLSIWYLHKTKPEAFSPLRWLRYHLLGTTMAGLSWCTIFPLIYFANDIVVTMTLSLLVFGIVGTSVMALSVYLPSFIAYTYPQIFSLLTSLFLFDNLTYQLLSLGVFIYLITITLFSLNLNRSAITALELQQKNMALINQLNEEINQRQALIQQGTIELSEKNKALTLEISERKYMERELLKSEKLLSSIFSASPTGMALLSTDLHYQLINETLAGLNGITIEDHIGKSMQKILPNIYKESFPYFQQVLRTKKSILNIDLSAKAPSSPGKISHFSISYFPVLDDSNHIISLGTVVVDITERKEAEQALRASEERFALAMKGANDGLYDWDLVNNKIYYSPRWKSMLGYEDDELPNDFSIWKDLFVATDQSQSWNIMREFINGSRDNFNLELKMRHKDGHWVDILSRAYAVRDEEGTAIRMVGTHLDVTELKNKESMIRVLSQAIEQSPSTVVITDTQANIEFINHSFEKVSGYTLQEVKGKNPRIFQSGLTPLKRYKEMWGNLLAKKPWSGEIQNKNKNGDIYWEYARIAPVIDESGHVSHYVGIKEDITEQKIQHEKILYQAHYDSLTNLPNRFLALDRLNLMIRESRRNNSKLAVLFLDLDGFKRINDSMGHDAGDRLLVMVAQRLSALIREIDSVCRLGGDEFIILLNKIDKISDAQLVAEHLLSQFKNFFTLDERELVITISIGIASYPEDGSSSDELLRNADTAMYRAKEMGRNTYQNYTPSMNKDISHRLAIEEQLHAALSREEFSVLYQPLIDLKTHMIIGVEALLRWHSSVLGPISPEDFIPIAEQSSSIDKIGQYVLSEAIAWTTKWRAISNQGFSTAVNLSPTQFRNPKLGTMISELLKKHNLPASALEVEITEGVLLSGYPDLDETINTFKNLGIGISMDDFGTGYSSLSYLRSYPFDTLKIDRSFINDISVDKADRELINAAISMGHGLGLKVIAEGIETEDQLSHLIQLGCDIGQGYLFSKPVTGEEIFELLSKHNEVGAMLKKARSV